MSRSTLATKTARSQSWKLSPHAIDTIKWLAQETNATQSHVQERLLALGSDAYLVECAARAEAIRADMKQRQTEAAS